MASLFRFDVGHTGEKRSVLFFSNPNHQEKRAHITIKASLDNGVMWPETHWVELDELTGAGYSCLARIDERTVGILYESSQEFLVFQRVPIGDFGLGMPQGE